MDLIITILPVVTKDLAIFPWSTPYNFLSRCKFSNLTTRQPMVGFCLLTFPRFPLRKKEHKSYFGSNRTHDFRTSRCAGYLLDHSGDERLGPEGLGKLLYFLHCGQSRLRSAEQGNERKRKKEKESKAAPFLPPSTGRVQYTNENRWLEGYYVTHLHA